MNTPPKIFIADADAASRKTLVQLLGTIGYTVAAFADAGTFLDVLTPDICGCLILDAYLPDMDGLDLQQALLARGARLPVIFLSERGTIPLAVRAIKAGALDFLIKPVDENKLLRRVRDALKQATSGRTSTGSHSPANLGLATLTKREREVMRLVIAGYTSKEIAQHLAISYRTVEIHRTHVMRKTGVSSWMELARLVDQLELPLFGDKAKLPG